MADRNRRRGDPKDGSTDGPIELTVQQALTEWSVAMDALADARVSGRDTAPAVLRMERARADYNRLKLKALRDGQE